MVPFRAYEICLFDFMYGFVDTEPLISNRIRHLEQCFHKLLQVEGIRSNRLYLFVIAGSRRARNLVCTPYLDSSAKIDR